MNLKYGGLTGAARRDLAIQLHKTRRQAKPPRALAVQNRVAPEQLQFAAA